MFQVGEMIAVAAPGTDSDLLVADDELPVERGTDLMESEEVAGNAADREEWAGALGLRADGRHRAQEPEEEDEFFDFDDDDDDDEEDEEFYDDDFEDDDDDGDSGRFSRGR